MKIIYEELPEDHSGTKVNIEELGIVNTIWSEKKPGFIKYDDEVKKYITIKYF